MFGFFDRKERKRKRALEAFGKEMQKDPLAERAMRSQKQLEILKRVEVLRNSGNSEKVSPEVMEWLAEDLERWSRSRDAYDLHYVVETLRLCGMIAEAYTFLGKAKHEWSKKIAIDPVWMCFDRGLVSHQLGEDPAIAIECFDEALACRAPEGARCSWRDEARLQAAFCGFVASSANGMEAETQQFLGILRELSPEKDWCSGQMLEEFGKGFIGFLSSDKQPAPDIGQLPPSAPPGNSPQEVKVPASPPAQESHLIHYCIFMRPKRKGEPEVDAKERALITAELRAAKTPEGGIKYTFGLNQGHDPLDLVEMDAAIFWYELFEEGRVSRDQVVLWIRDFDRAVGTNYSASGGSDLSTEKNIVFFGALCSIAMHAFIAFLDSVETKHDEAARWFRQQIDQNGSGIRRAGAISTAEKVRGLMTRGEIDPAFSRLLCKSVGMRVD